jgi:DNA-binding beta-propeller fold protein YncE
MSPRLPDRLAAPRSRRLLLPLLVAAAALSACKAEVVCTSTQVLCDGQCTSLESDAAHCGACGRACGPGLSCSAGLCCEGSQCPPAVYAACFNGSAVQGATAAPVPVGAPVAVETGPISLAWRGSALWVANSISNTLDRMQVSPSGLVADGAFPTVSIPVSGPFSDLEFLAERDGVLHVSNAAVGSLVLVDPSAVSPIVGEVQLGSFSFPQGVAFAGGSAYVALNGSSEVAVVDLATRTVRKRIDLSALASAGALALPSRLAVVDGRVYVTLWNLDATFSPAGNGRLAVIDTATEALVPGVNPLDLGSGCQNPAGLAALGSTLWVTCGFFPYSATSAADITGAGFVPVDLSGAAPQAGVAVPAGGAAPGALVFCGGTGFAADRFSGNVLRFDPVAGAVAGRGLVCAPSPGGSSFVADVACGR